MEARSSQSWETESRRSCGDTAGEIAGLRELAAESEDGERDVCFALVAAYELEKLTSSWGLSLIGKVDRYRMPNLLFVGGLG